MTNPGHFGPGVIGEEQYEAECEIRETAAHVYGPGVLSPDPVEHVTLRNRVGPGVAETKEQAGPETIQPSAEIKRDEHELPAGFELTHIGGGRFAVTLPSGTKLDGSFKGRAGALGAIDSLLESMDLVSPAEEDAGSASGPGTEAALEPEEAETPEESLLLPPVRPEPELAPDMIEQAIELADGSEAAVSIPRLEQIVEESPESIDRLFIHEMNRPEGQPRKGALRALLSAEQRRKGGARPAMINAIEHALAG